MILTINCSKHLRLRYLSLFYFLHEISSNIKMYSQQYKRVMIALNIKRLESSFIVHMICLCMRAVFFDCNSIHYDSKSYQNYTDYTLETVNMTLLLNQTKYFSSFILHSINSNGTFIPLLYINLLL